MWSWYIQPSYRWRAAGRLLLLSWLAALTLRLVIDDTMLGAILNSFPIGIFLTTLLVVWIAVAFVCFAVSDWYRQRGR
jgi:hypothetical protein